MPQINGVINHISHSHFTFHIHTSYSHYITDKTKLNKDLGITELNIQMFLYRIRIW